MTACCEHKVPVHTLYKELTIIISERLPLQRTQVALLHELVHVTEDVLGNDNGLTELQVTAIATGLYDAIFCDNPDVLAFLSQTEAE